MASSLHFSASLTHCAEISLWTLASTHHFYLLLIFHRRMGHITAAIHGYTGNNTVLNHSQLGFWFRLHLLSISATMWNITQWQVPASACVILLTLMEKSRLLLVVMSEACKYPVILSVISQLCSHPWTTSCTSRHQLSHSALQSDCFFNSN